jgi:sterol desaturase/sphingolipid hydroxylase (fatty acid hydroxylase superfamily)
MDWIETRFAAFGDMFDVLELVGAFFLVLIVSESLWDLITRQRSSARETLANFTIAIVSLLLDRTVYGLVFILGLFWAESLTPLALPLTWWSWALAIVLADFTYYWMHRWEHEVRLLWAYHTVHHSSPEYNLTTSLRLAWVEGLIEWVFFVPMILIGFDAVQAIAALSVVVIYQTWIHTEKIGKLGWLDRVFNTPSVHRVHHGSNRKYLDRNYGGILILWDRLFGTYQAEEEPAVYGITKPLGTSNPITINLHEFVQIGRDVARAASWSQALGHVFRRPGWQPEGK